MKHEIRAYGLEKRDSLGESEIGRNSSIIQKKLTALEEFSRAETVMLYMSFGSEVRTEALIEECIEREKRVAVPITNTKDNLLHIVEFPGFEKMRKNRFGILEPELKSSDEIPAEEIDLVVVPGIAFDRKGSRIGFGHGYYDRLLKKLKPSCTKVALAFELQMHDSIACDPHDVPIGIIVTEKRIIRCK